jgi:hypothetical protein
MADFFDQWEQWLQRLEQSGVDVPAERTWPVADAERDGAGGDPPRLDRELEEPPGR